MVWVGVVGDDMGFVGGICIDFEGFFVFFLNRMG